MEDVQKAFQSQRGSSRTSEQPQGGAVRVVCAVPYPLGIVPGQRFRWEQWAPFIRSEGIDFDFVPFATSEIQRARGEGHGARAAALAAKRWPGWFGEMLAARRADLLVVYRNAALAGPPIAELVLHRLGLPFVYDFDDAIYLAPEAGDDPLRRALRADWRAAVLCRRATLVSVGNRTLEKFAARYNPRHEVWPTTIVAGGYPARAEPRAAGTPTVGWMGSPSTAPYLTELLPALREAQQKSPFRLLVVGARIDLRGVLGECIDWSSDTEIQSLHRMDIGVMPLPNTPWSRAKCGAKAVQYLGAGVPAIVSDVGVSCEVVPDGLAGFVVRERSEWVERLAQLLADAALRRRMGAAGRAHVHRNYSAEAWAPRIANRLREIALSARTRTRESVVSRNAVRNTLRPPNGQ